MKPMPHIPVVILLIGCTLLLLIGIQLLFPGGVIVQSTVGDASVHFAADRSAVLAFGDCVRVEWRVDHIREVYYNDQPATGEGSSVYCLQNRQTVILRVIFQDGSEQTYTLFIRTLADRQEIWIVAALAVMCFGASVITALTNRIPLPTSEKPTPFQRLLTGIGSAVILFVWTCLLLEGILRLYFNVMGTEAQKVAYVYSRDEINQLRPANIPLPQIDYAPSPNTAGINQFGMRNEEFSAEKPDGVYRIVALGDSTTYGFLLPPGDSYPAQLERILRDDYGYTNVQVINAGVLGYTSFQIVQNFSLRLLEFDPDLAIYYGSNDYLYREVDPECYRGDNILRGLDPRGLVANFPYDDPLSWSVLHRFLTINFGLTSNPSQLSGLFVKAPVECGGDETGNEAENTLANQPIYYERNLMNLVGVARIHQVQLMFSSWAYQRDSTNAADYWREAVDQQNQVIQAVAQEYDVPFIDFASSAPQDAALWSDYTHMTYEGLRQQAQTYAAYIDAQGLIPRP